MQSIESFIEQAVNLGFKELVVRAPSHTIDQLKSKYSHCKYGSEIDIELDVDHFSILMYGITTHFLVDDE